MCTPHCCNQSALAPRCALWSLAFAALLTVVGKRYSQTPFTRGPVDDQRGGIYHLPGALLLEEAWDDHKSLILVCAGSARRGRGVQDGRWGSAEQALDRLARQPAGGGGGSGSLCRLQPLVWDGRPARHLSLFMWLSLSWFPAKALGAVGTLTPPTQSSYSLWFPPRVARAQF